MIYYESNYLCHYGLKGMKWGVRRWQNEDGTFNEAGKKRYFNSDGTLNARGKKRQAKIEYKNAKKAIRKEREKINETYDKKKAENAWGNDSGGVKDRIKGHLKNEYERSQALNKLDQKELDAKRKYRTDSGKKKTDTLLMKWGQESINDISKQTQGEFNRQYITNAISDAYNVAVYNLNYYRS